MIIQASRNGFQTISFECFDRVGYKMFSLSTIITDRHVEIIHRDDSWHYSVHARAHLDIIAFSSTPIAEVSPPTQLCLSLVQNSPSDKQIVSK